MTVNAPAATVSASRASANASVTESASEANSADGRAGGETSMTAEDMSVMPDSDTARAFPA